MRLPVRLLVVGTLCALVAAAARGQDAAAPAGADATVTFSGRVVGVGLGYVWGIGALEFKGTRYAVKVDGMMVGEVGADAVTAHGWVYHLQAVDDLNGQYSAVGVSGTLAGGEGALRMRNAKGVEIAVVATMRGLELGAGPRGITLQVLGESAPPSGVLPQTLGFGLAEYGPLSLQPTLNVQIAGFAEGNAGFNGTWGVGPLQDSDVFFETSNEVGGNALLDLGRYGTVKGRVSGTFSLTGGGIDAGATNGATINNHSYAIEDAYLTWQSGNAFPRLGFNAVAMSYGNQNYQIFDGLLFWNGGQNGGPRGAAWLAPRKAFREAGILTLSSGGALLEGFHLKFNDDPDTDTRFGGGRLRYTFEDVIVKYMQTGLMYFNFYESQNKARDGLNVFYLYQETTPLTRLPDLAYSASFVAELNSEAAGLSQAYGWFLAPAYTFSTLPWTPVLTYRFASFSGGGTRGFDPLFGSVSEWGTWVQGELLGEWVIANSNLQSHMVRLKLTPNEIFTLHLIYFKFLLDNLHQSFGAKPTRVSSYQLADEVDAILDVTLTNWWSMTVECTLAVPDDGFRQAVGGSATWLNSMLYMNFNF